MTSLRTYAQEIIYKQIVQKTVYNRKLYFISKLYGARSVEKELRERASLDWVEAANTTPDRGRGRHIAGRGLSK